MSKLITMHFDYKLSYLLWDNEKHYCHFGDNMNLDLFRMAIRSETL